LLLISAQDIAWGTISKKTYNVLGLKQWGSVSSAVVAIRRTAKKW